METAKQSIASATANKIISNRLMLYLSLCPFISLFLSHYTVAGEIIWALNYALTGLLTVYGVILFSDLSENALYLAGFGLICRRIGEPIGASLGTAFSSSPVILITFTSIAFVAAVFCSAALAQSLYLETYGYRKKRNETDGNNSHENTLQEIHTGEFDTEENKCAAFATKYAFSSRELDVFREVIKGNTNPKIAEDLFITENTVKFHIKNLLKKTGASNKAELIELFQNK